MVRDPLGVIDERDLTEPERRLVDATLAGEPLSCADTGCDVRAEVIRDLVVGRHGELDPRGLRLQNAVVTGQLDLDGVHCSVPVRLIRCRFDEPVLARGAQLSYLSLAGSEVPGLYAGGVRIGDSLFLNDGFTAAADDTDAAVRLRGARIGGLLDCGGARLTNASGPALVVDNARVDGGVLLNDGFVADGRGLLGAVRMVDAQVGGQVDLSNARLTNATGATLMANRMVVTGDLFMRGAFVSHGTSTKSLIRLNSARLGGLEVFPGVRLANPEGPALGLKNATTEWVRFPAEMLCSPDARGRCEPAGIILLNGFTYATLTNDGADWRRWLHWVRHHTSEYTAQPYQQLAAAQRSAGHDRAARSILITQQNDLRVRGDVGGWWARSRHRLWGALAGYGYRAGRAATALLAVLVLAAAIGWVAGHTPTHDGRFAALHTTSAERPFTPCSTLELVGLGIDRGLPLGATGIRDRCDLDTTSSVGQVFTAAIWLLQAVVWALATLVIAGYTGLIRKIA
jgi:hypothetical protein